MNTSKLFNLNRYQKETVDISSGGEFKPHLRDAHKQTHVWNKAYAICRFQKNVLENFTKWPPGTYFKIE